jgi:hypothetical protein
MSFTFPINNWTSCSFYTEQGLLAVDVVWFEPERLQMINYANVYEVSEFSLNYPSTGNIPLYSIYKLSQVSPKMSCMTHIFFFSLTCFFYSQFHFSRGIHLDKHWYCNKNDNKMIIYKMIIVLIININIVIILFTYLADKVVVLSWLYPVTHIVLFTHIH